jgi:hypothetical protein
MFSSSNQQQQPSTQTAATPQPKEEQPKFSKISSLYSYGSLNDVRINETKQEDIDKFLENEKQSNKNESWNKLNKSTKIQKMHIYAERYGKEQGFSAKEVKQLKVFFCDCLERGKLIKTKEVNYDKNTHEIVDIPGIYYHPTNHNFTIRSNEAKRISTIKSLTPKRVTEKNKETNDDDTKNEEEEA